MKLVVDTNRIIAALIKDSFSRRILFSHKFHFYSIAFSQKEVKKYEKMILQKAGISKNEYTQLFERLFARIELFDETEIKKENFGAALEVMEPIDPMDTPFLALAIQEKCPVWSDDKHFQKQKKAKVLETKQLARFV